LLRGPLGRVAGLRPGVRLRLVGHEPIAFGGIEVDFRPWSPGEQDLALRECDIGLCPMPDTPWTRGKCPYKVLQYMAHAMPWVGSAVGENLRAAGAPDGPDTRGLCAATDDEWVSALLRLADNVELRKRLGSAGRAYVEGNHDRGVLADRLAEAFRGIAAAARNEP